MTAQPVQIDLFDTPPAAPAPTAASRADGIHWLVVTTRRAGTACGIVVSDYYLKDRSAMPDEGDLIRCTHDRFDGTVTCARCKEAMW